MRHLINVKVPHFLCSHGDCPRVFSLSHGARHLCDMGEIADNEKLLAKVFDGEDKLMAADVL